MNTRRIVTPENYKYPSLRPVLTFLVFVVLGPAIGGVALVVLSWIASLPSDLGQLQWINRPKAFLHAVVFVQLFTYFLGGLQALVVGALASIFHLRDPGGPVPLAPVLVGSILCALVFLALLWRRGEALQIATSVVLLLVHVGAGLGCWLIANALLWLVGFRPSAPMTSTDQTGIT
jgi:hypothetical protein